METETQEIMKEGNGEGESGGSNYQRKRRDIGRLFLLWA